MIEPKHSPVALRAILLLVVFFSQNILANETNVAARNMLQLSAIPIASGSFIQRKYFKVLKQPIKSQGELYFDVNLGLLWQTNRPLYSALILKNNSVYTEDGRNPAKELKGANSLSLMLLSILSGDREQVAENFTFARGNTEGCTNLTPKLAQLAKLMQAIELCQKNSKVNNGLGLNHIDQIILREHGGNRTEIDVKLTVMPALPESVRARLN